MKSHRISEEEEEDEGNIHSDNIYLLLEHSFVYVKKKREGKMENSYQQPPSVPSL